MGGGGKGGGASGAVDFPAYMKTFHGLMLDDAGVDTVSLTLVAAFNTAVSGNSPYFNYKTATDPLGNLFGLTATMATGKVFDLLKVFQDVNFNTTLAAYNGGGSTVDLMASVSTTLDDEITTNILPKFKANLRGIGAVQSSAYVVGEAIIWDAKVKAIAKERLQIETLAMQWQDSSLRITAGYLEFKKLCAFAAADVAKSFYSLKYDIDDHYMEVAAKDLKWDLEMFQYLEQGLGSISGSAVTAPGKGASKVGSAIGGALSGAAMGAAIGMAGGPTAPITAPMGALLGGAIGLGGALMG